jgi:hypothetical protein
MVYELMWSREPRTLALCLLVEEVLEGRRVAVADAANCMDPYVLARVVHRQRLDRRLLSRVVVSRAFTCHQLAQLLQERLNMIETDRVLVIDPGALLYDAVEVKPVESMRVARQIARTLERFEGAPVTVTLGEPPRSHVQVFEIFYAHARGVSYESVRLKGGTHGKNGAHVQPSAALGDGGAEQIPPSLAAGGAGGVR